MSDRVQTLFEQSISRVVKAYEAGKDLKAISQRVGVSAPTVAKWLTQEGYKHKGKGRYPVAMKTRARDLRRRGWDVGKIASLLKVPPERIKEWSSLKSNPVLGGEKDPLKLKGETGKKKKKKKKKLKSSKKNKPGYPPPKHKCRKHWKRIEEEYVIELMKKGVSVLGIYRRMRASKKRQSRIWKKYGGKGRPPNFPPSKPRPVLPGPPSKGAAARRKSIIAEDEKRIAELEARYNEAQSAIIAQQEQIKELEGRRKEEMRALQAVSERRKALEAWEKRAPPRLPPGKPPVRAPTVTKRRVKAGSYEADVLKLPVGSIIKEPKPKRVPKSIPEWADNGEFFEVSNQWGPLADLNDLKGATADELQIFANFLTREGFPSKVTPDGDQPKAFYKDAWPKGVARKWNQATRNALIYLQAYIGRKKNLVDNQFSPKRVKAAGGLLSYLRDAYDAYKNPDTTPKQKAKAEAQMKQVWRQIDPIDRALLIFWRGFADPSGIPTQKGIEWGPTAKRLLIKEDEDRIAKSLTERKKTREKAREKTKMEEAQKLLAARRRELAAEEAEEEDEWD